MTFVQVATAAICLALSACQAQDASDDGRQPAPATTTVDASGNAPPQPSPNGGDTPVGAAGVEGADPPAQTATSTGPTPRRP